MVYEVIVDGKTHRLELERNERVWKCRLDGKEIIADAVLVRPDVLSLLVDGRSYEIKREQTTNDLHLWVSNKRFAVELRDPRSLRARRDGAGQTSFWGPLAWSAPSRRARNERGSRSSTAKRVLLTQK